MTKFTGWDRAAVIDLLERTIAGRDIGYDWDDLGMRRQSADPFTRHWAKRIVDVETLYPPRHQHELFAHPGGLDHVKGLLDELRRTPDA